MCVWSDVVGGGAEATPRGRLAIILSTDSGSLFGKRAEVTYQTRLFFFFIGVVKWQ
jgi:hypothetical protein